VKLSPDKLNYLHDTLDKLLLEPWLVKHAIEKDPVGILHDYIDPLNIEVSGLIASCLSYGKQSIFRPIVQRILDQMGHSPVNYLLESDPSVWTNDFDWFRYRFTTKYDLMCLMLATRNIIKTYGTIEFSFGFDVIPNIHSAMSSFVDRMYNQDFSPLGPIGDMKGFKYLLPHPVKNSACKRLNMFVRWMCRRDEIDVGIWKFDKSKLVIPLDTHINRISKKLGLTTKSGTSWKVAEDITDSLRQLNPKDPLIYDFPICNAGVIGKL